MADPVLTGIWNKTDAENPRSLGYIDKDGAVHTVEAGEKKNLPLDREDARLKAHAHVGWIEVGDAYPEGELGKANKAPPAPQE